MDNQTFYIVDQRDECVIASGSFTEMDELLDTMSGNLILMTKKEILNMFPDIDPPDPFPL